MDDQLRNFADLLSGCLEMDPKERFNAEDCLLHKYFGFEKIE